jgi:hypothetical protein
MQSDRYPFIVDLSFRFAAVLRFIQGLFQLFKYFEGQLTFIHVLEEFAILELYLEHADVVGAVAKDSHLQTILQMRDGLFVLLLGVKDEPVGEVDDPRVGMVGGKA